MRNRSGDSVDLPDGEAGVAAHGHERLDVFQRNRVLHGAQHRRDLVAQHLGRLFGRIVAGGQYLVQADGAQPQALRGDDLAVAEERQQGAAAADIDDQGVAAIDVQRPAQRLADRRDGEAALFGRADDLDLQPRGKVDAVQEGIRVAGFAGGASGHGPNVLHLVEIQQLAEIAEDRQGHAHAGGPQASAAKGVLSQPGRTLCPLNDLDAAVGLDLGDDHPQGVRAHVDGRNRLGLERFVRFFCHVHEDEGQLASYDVRVL